MNRFFSSEPVWQTAGLTLIRFIVGSFMIYHGLELFDKKIMDGYLQWDLFKDSSSAKIMVYAGKTTELVAGVFLFIGLFTRIAAILIIGALGYIAFFVGHGKIWYDDQYPFLFVLLGLVFFFVGGGRLSLDHLLFKKDN